MGIVKMTSKWYAAVLNRMTEGHQLLDVGVGTAAALARNKDKLLAKKLRVVGIDYESAYIEKAKKLASQHSIADRLELHCASVYDDLRPLQPNEGKELFDAAYFSGSITLLPDPAAALRAVAKVVKPGGPIYVTQTFQLKPSPMMERLKPLLKYLTTVDFGKLTYMSEIYRIAEEAGMEISENSVIESSIQTSKQSARL